MVQRARTAVAVRSDGGTGTGERLCRGLAMSALCGLSLARRDASTPQSRCNTQCRRAVDARGLSRVSIVTRVMSCQHGEGKTVCTLWRRRLVNTRRRAEKAPGHPLGHSVTCVSLPPTAPSAMATATKISIVCAVASQQPRDDAWGRWGWGTQLQCRVTPNAGRGPYLASWINGCVGAGERSKLRRRRQRVAAIHGGR